MSYPEYDQYKIKNLCTKQDSCEQCRNARMNDEGYQNYLDNKRKFEKEQYKIFLNKIRNGNDEYRKQHYGV